MTGTDLKIMRMSHGLTIKEASKAIGLSVVTLCRLENDQIKGHRNTWQKLAAFYGIPTEKADKQWGKNKKKGN